MQYKSELFDRYYKILDFIQITDTKKADDVWWNIHFPPYHHLPYHEQLNYFSSSK